MSEFFNAVDIYGCPPDNMKMARQLIENANVRIIAAYLRHCPVVPDHEPLPEEKAPDNACGDCRNDDTGWNDVNRIDKLRKLGFGFIPTFCGSQVGQTFRSPKGWCAAITKLNAVEIGEAEGNAAVDLASNASFGTKTVIYFDNEGSVDARKDENYVRFMKTWADTVRSRGYIPGMYGHANENDDDQAFLKFWRKEAGIKCFWTEKTKFKVGRSHMDGKKKVLEDELDFSSSTFPDSESKEKYAIVENGGIATQYARQYLIKNVKFAMYLDIDGFRISLSKVKDPGDASLVATALGHPV